MTDKAKLMRAVLQIFIDAVKEGGDHGAPAGVMYAAVQDKLSLAQFEQIMAALVRTGKIRKAGQLYYFVADL